MGLVLRKVRKSRLTPVIGLRTTNISCDLLSRRCLNNLPHLTPQVETMKATAPAPCEFWGWGPAEAAVPRALRGARMETFVVRATRLGHLKSRPTQAARRTGSTFSVTLRDASSAVCSDIWAILRVPSIMPSRWSRNASLWAAARSWGVRQRVNAFM